jgi:Flp pilus assembly protein TadD
MARPAPLFVSHSQRDDDWCRAFGRALGLAGADVWYNRHNLRDTRQSIVDVTARELAARPIFLAILSPAAVISPLVQREMESALALQLQHPERVTIPVTAEPCAVPPIWRLESRIVGPDDTALSPEAAALRAKSVLALVPPDVDRAPAPPDNQETAPQAWERGKALMAQERPLEALAAYERAIALAPGKGAYWCSRGIALQAVGRADEALEAFSRATTLDSRYVLAWTLKGHLCWARGQFQQAQEAYDRALALNPQDARAWSDKGKTLWQSGQYDEALTRYERALALDADLAAAWHGKGLALRALGQLDEALRAFDRALELDPQAAPAAGAKGNVLAEIGRPREALAAYERALELDPRQARSWTGKGNTLAV